MGDFRAGGVPYNGSNTDYTYYPNGSLKSDANKGISLIEYNTYLNKVKQVTWSDGRWLKLNYDGGGWLIKKENSAGEYWNYVGDLIYKNGTFYSINIPEGRAAFNNGIWNYEFDYRDIWGNLRVSFSAENGQLTLKQKSDYDALGYTFNQSSGVNKNFFQYQKQQRIEDFDLNIDFFKFRPSDPTIGRFWMVDPLSSQYPHNSVYALQENKFGKYLSSPTLEMRTQLFNRINRIRDFDDATLKRMKKGSSFEDAVLKNRPHIFENQIVEKVRNMLPASRVEQMPIKFTHQNIQFYGFADVVGEGKVIDIKTTSSYKPHKFQYNFQNLYMYALRDKGCSSMEYIIYDFKEIHIETYPLATYDFSAMLHHMELFTEFLEENRPFITDKKIFVEEVKGGLFG